MNEKIYHLSVIYGKFISAFSAKAFNKSKGKRAIDGVYYYPKVKD